MNLEDIKIGTLHPNGEVTDPHNLVWTEMEEETIISQKLHNDKWPYFLVIKMINMNDACGEEGFMATIDAVSPKTAGKKNVDKVLDSCGFDSNRKLSLEQKAVILSEYGIEASLWNKRGDDYNVLLNTAKTEAERINILFDLYMDRPENMIGATGWDMIKGDIWPKKVPKCT